MDWRDKEIIVNSFDAPIFRGAHPDLTIMDEVHSFYDTWLKECIKDVDAKTYDWMVAAIDNYGSTGSRGPAVNEKQGSKITVDFNRRLTPSEKFTLRLSLDAEGVSEVVLHTQDFERSLFPIDPDETKYTSVTVTAPGWDDPVILLREIASLVEDNFLNVHPISVQTHYPRIDGRG